MAEQINSIRRRVLKSTAILPAVLSGGLAATTPAWPMPAVDSMRPRQKSFALAAMRALTNLAAENPKALAVLAEHDLDALLTAGFGCDTFTSEQVIAAKRAALHGRAVAVIKDGPLLAPDVSEEAADAWADFMEIEGRA